MVETERVVQSEAMGNTPTPPGIGILFHSGEIVEAIAPHLTLCRKSVRRHSRRSRGTVVLVEQKVFFVHPDVHAVGGDVERKVADHAHAPVVYAFLDRQPLSEKDELLEAVEIHFFRVPGARLGKRPFVSVGKSAFPVPPLGAPLGGKCHKQRVIFQPVFFLCRELRHFFAKRRSNSSVRRTEDAGRILTRKVVVHEIGLAAIFRVFGLFRSEQTVLEQSRRIDEEAVARKGRYSGIGRISRAYDRERQHLPPVETHIHRHIDKHVDVARKTTYPVNARHREQRHKHARRPREFRNFVHFPLSPFILPLL